MILQHILAVLLFLQLALPRALGEICPHPEDISPCKCRYDGSLSNIHVDCVGGNVTDIAKAFSEFEGTSIQKVVLRNVQNGRLPSLLFWNVKVKELSIASCQLQGISDTDRRPAFVGLENSLERLTIDNSITGVNKLESVNLAHLTKLTELVFSRNNIPEVGNEWFEKGPFNLRTLKFESCSIRKLGNTAFNKLNLGFLRIYNCPIRTFKRSMLSRPTDRLATLSLRFSNLASPPDDLFEEMPKLRWLYLDGNFIRRLQSKTFSTVWPKLDTFDLSKNPLECDSHMDWLLPLKRPVNLLGNCAAPEKEMNVTLASFIDSKKTYLVSNSFTL